MLCFKKNRVTSWLFLQRLQLHFRAQIPRVARRWNAKDIRSLSGQSERTFKRIHSFSIYEKKIAQVYEDVDVSVIKNLALTNLFQLSSLGV